MSLYPDNEKQFSEEQFADPSAEYRDIPFWAWNTGMTEEDITFCLEIFREMGMGGAFLHSRTGLTLPYLGRDYLDRIRYAVKQAEKKGLRPWLYDEDRWPSGFAGGLVTVHQEYRSRFLVWSPVPYPQGKVMEDSEKTSTAKAVRSGSRKLLGVYRVSSREGYLSAYEQLGQKEAEAVTAAAAGERAQDLSGSSRIWWAYLEISGDNPWFNGQSYVDTLSPKAVKRFLEVTYVKYRDTLGEAFGGLVPGIFTDEPQFTPKQRAGSIDSRKAVILPFTDRIPELFKREYGYDLLAHLPELFYEKEGAASQIRYFYHDLVSRLFAESYAGQIGQWCEQNGIALTGHLMKEPLLSYQTAYIGEAMRCYAGFQIPGIDMLCDRREFTTAKQAQSAVHQYGREGMISELYGVTNWDFDFRGHKLQGDWQAALGVTLRAPHLAWTSMEGEAKRDYPASIFYQSPWYREYRLIEDYFARIAMVMSRGRAVVNIGVIHPVESCWLYWGTLEKTQDIVKELDEQFVRLTEQLIGYYLDFDFISESLLPALYQGTAGGFRVGRMKYQVILVPFLETIRAATLKLLTDWQAVGGKVIFIGKVPEYVDGRLSSDARRLASKCKFLPFSPSQIFRELESYVFLELFYGDYERAGDLVYQIREEKDCMWIFIAHRYAPERKDQAVRRELTVRIKGLWSCKVLDAMEGKVRAGETLQKKEKYATIFKTNWYEHDSLLLQLTAFCPEESEKKSSQQAAAAARKPVACGSRVPVTLTEPNVLVLDMPEYSFAGESREAEEILRIDDLLRKRMGYPLRMEACPQPWTLGQEIQEAGEIRLRYVISSRIDCREVRLGLEQPQDTRILWNGKKIRPEKEKEGWYTDRRIRTILLGELHKGQNELCLIRQFSGKTNLEAVYLLGDFGVKVTGRHAEIVEPVRELCFGSWTMQGLPFYGGNVIYHIGITGSNRPVEIEISRFAAPLLAVDMEGKRQGVIAFSPYRLRTGAVREGSRTLDVTAFGSRINTFGALHNCDTADNKAAPNYWRTTGSAWSYEYCLRPAGILKTPVITTYFTEEGNEC